MSFLTLNGVTIPVMRAERSAEPGNRGLTRTFDGSAIQEFSTLKRVWGPFTTAPMSRSFARALSNMLLGRGDMFTRIGGETVGGLLGATDSFSWKGLKADDGFVATMLPATASDGADIASHSTTLNGAVQVDPAHTNVATARSTEGDDSLWTGLGGATVVNTADHALIGAGSVLVTIDAGQTAYRSACASGLAALTTYTVSFYVKQVSGSGDKVSVVLSDITNGVNSSSESIDLVSGTWVRHTDLSVTTGALGAVALRFQFGSPNSAMSFAVDGIQVEAATHSSAFRDSAVAVAAGELEYPASRFTEATDGWTFVCQTTGPNLSQVATSSCLVHAYMGAGMTNNSFRITRTANANTVNAVVTGIEGTVNTVSASSVWDGNWHTLAVVVRLNPGAGEYGVEIWMDGVMVASGNLAAGTYFDPGEITGMDLGWRTGSGTEWGGPIDSAMVLPYPLSSEFLESMTDPDFPFDAPPKMYLTGDASEGIQLPGVEVYGRDVSSTVMQGRQASATAWQNNLEQVTFSLVER